MPEENLRTSSPPHTHPMKRASSCDEIENVPHVLQQHHTAGLRHRRQPALTPLAHGHCGRPSLLSLPDDCVARILDSLGVEQLLRVTCVSRTLTELCMSNAAWRRRCALAGLGGDLLAAAQRRAERRAAARRSGRESGGTGVGAGIPAHGDGAPVAPPVAAKVRARVPCAMMLLSWLASDTGTALSPSTYLQTPGVSAARGGVVRGVITYAPVFGASLTLRPAACCRVGGTKRSRIRSL